jgi:hypothetical protein
MAREDLNEADFPELSEGQMDMENETVLSAHHQSRNGPGKTAVHKEAVA